MSRTRALSWVVALCAVTTLAPERAEAQQAAPPPSASSVVRRARALRAAGEVRGAIELLKAAVKAKPREEWLRHALAMAYVQDHNEFWALKVLREFEQQQGPACATRAFMAWIELGQADLDAADELLVEPGCEGPPEIRARMLLLRARIASQRRDHARARQLAAEASSQTRFYEEDRAALDALRSRDEPGHLPFTAWRVDVALGWTSNGLAGSPQDPAEVARDTSSAVVQTDARLRVVVPASRAIRPTVELELRTAELLSSEVRSLSYRQPAIRPGVLFGTDTPTLLLSYGVDAVQIAASDRYQQGPLWYSEGHRIDYELEAGEGLMAFGGAGHRTYREAGRTRWEAEQGLAVGFSATSAIRGVAGGSVRWHRAANRAYDAFGGTALAQVSIQLPAQLEARLNGAASLDDYPRSDGYFAGALGQARRDIQARIKPGLWSPAWEGLRLGVDYEYAHRSSTASSYSYTDHRVLLHLTWVSDSDRLGVTTLPREGREPMSYGIGASGQASAEESRVRDLMRQDEAVKRGSSCLN